MELNLAPLFSSSHSSCFYLWLLGSSASDMPAILHSEARARSALEKAIASGDPISLQEAKWIKELT